MQKMYLQVIDKAFLLYCSAPLGTQLPRNAGWRVGGAGHQGFDTVRHSEPDHQKDKTRSVPLEQMKNSGCSDRRPRGFYQ